MSKHKMVDGRLLQMDKSFGQLKQKQREKIAEWMYCGFGKGTSYDSELSSDGRDRGGSMGGGCNADTL